MSQRITQKQGVVIHFSISFGLLDRLLPSTNIKKQDDSFVMKASDFPIDIWTGLQPDAIFFQAWFYTVFIMVLDLPKLQSTSNVNMYCINVSYVRYDMQWHSSVELGLIF